MLGWPISSTLSLTRDQSISRSSLACCTGWLFTFFCFFLADENVCIRWHLILLMLAVSLFKVIYLPESCPSCKSYSIFLMFPLVYIVQMSIVFMESILFMFLSCCIGAIYLENYQVFVVRWLMLYLSWPPLLIQLHKNHLAVFLIFPFRASLLKCSFYFFFFGDPSVTDQL